MAAHTMKSVLGDARDAEVRFPESDHPWIECPFGGSAVYLGAPSDAHPTYPSRDGVCRDPWCIANPDMPLDRARELRGAAILAEMEDESRARNRASALARIAEENAAKEKLIEDARERERVSGECATCYILSGYRKSVKHRNGCPRRNR